MTLGLTHPLVDKLVERLDLDELETLSFATFYGRQAVLARMPYQDYLQTLHWRRMRERALTRAGHRCQLCNSGHRLEVHHRTYENRGTERDEDLTVLCDPCHRRFHRTSSLESTASWLRTARIADMPERSTP